jgi:thioredoxin reductase (NADPH)
VDAEHRPVILAVDDDPDAIGLLGSELEDRYGRAYTVLTARAVATAQEQLTDLAAAGWR